MDNNGLAKKYGTPAYVYNLDLVGNAYNSLVNCLPAGSRLYYSIKANPHPLIVKRLAELGCLIEISSTGECETALLAGVLPGNCLYTGPGKGQSEIHKAITHGINHFSIESWHDFEKISNSAKYFSATVYGIIRINPSHYIGGYGLVMTGKATQFGIDEDDLNMLPMVIKKYPNVEIVGTHIYAGSNISSVDLLINTFQHAIKISAKLLDQLKLDIKLIDIGGGFAHPFGTNEIRADYTEIKDKLKTCIQESFPKKKPVIAFESGRFLVAGAGKLLISVVDIKVSKGEAFAIVDGGINHLGGMTGLGRLSRIRIDFEQKKSISSILQRYSIVGPLCSPLDYFVKGVELEPISIGDILTIPNVGAYGLTASLLAFLSRDPPLEIITEKGIVTHVSRLSLTRREEQYE